MFCIVRMLDYVYSRVLMWSFCCVIMIKSSKEYTMKRENSALLNKWSLYLKFSFTKVNICVSWIKWYAVKPIQMQFSFCHTFLLIIIISRQGLKNKKNNFKVFKNGISLPMKATQIYRFSIVRALNIMYIKIVILSVFYR